MSAETLRRAAALMRERAEGATPGGPRWETAPDGALPSLRYIFPADSDSAVTSAPAADAEHMASWHPDVALAVADLLDDLAQMHDDTGISLDGWPAPLNLARAYLGEQP